MYQIMELRVILILMKTHFTYLHDQVLHCLALGLSKILAELNTVHIYVY